VSLTSPLRHPDTRQPELMTTRAWWLLGVNLLIPGSAQLLAGDRKWGRFAVGATFASWAVAAAALLLLLLARPVALTIVTNVPVLWAMQFVLIFYGVLWLVTTVNALALARIIRATPRSRAPLAGFVVLTLLLGVGGATWGAWVTAVARDTLDNVFAGGFIDPPIDGRYTVLLLGGDAGPDRIGLRPDSISLASIDAETGAVTMIGIPRNLYNAPFSAGSPLWKEWPTGFDCGDDCLVSYLYPWAEEHPELYPAAGLRGTTPGIEAMRDAVEGITGLAVQYVVLIDMEGFAQLVDALGGVTVTVAEGMDLGINGGPVVGRIEAGEQRMDGATALWYARNRYNLTDFDRMLHQRQIQEAILRQIEPATVLTRFQAIAEAGTQVVRTDIPRAMLGLLTELAAKARELPIVDIELTPPTIDNVEPDYELVRQLVAEAVAPREAE
jgi:polyisoprenyl-teichoic acid--peptidoglycan teichoic acid transferase